MKEALIFLLILALYMGLAITGLAYENLALRREVMRACGGK